MIGQIAPRVKLTLGIPFRFRALPSEVMASRTLSSTAKLLFAAIVDAARGKRSGLCRIANATLADRIGRSESEVGRCLLELEAAALVRRVYGPSKHVRVGVEITWSETVPQECGAEQALVHSVPGTGSPSLGNPVPDVPGPGRTVVEPGQTAGSLVSKEEKTGSSPPLSAEAIRRAIADGIAGQYAPMLFDAEPTPTTSPASEPTPKADAKAKPSPAKPATPARTAKPESHGGFDLRRVGVSAVAAAWSPSWGAAPKYTPADIERQLRERRRRIARAGGPSPAPDDRAGSASATSAQTEQSPALGRDFAVRL